MAYKLISPFTLHYVQARSTSAFTIKSHTYTYSFKFLANVPIYIKEVIMLRLITNPDYTPNAKQLRINEKKTAILNHLTMMWSENFIDGRKYWSYRAILGAALARNGRYSEKALRMINTDGMNTICVFYIQDFIFMTRQLIHLMMQDKPALYLISGGKDDTPGMRQIRRNMKAWDLRKKKSEPPRYR